MINFVLNTGYEFIFTGFTVNNLIYKITVYIIYGIKADLIETFNCPNDMAIEIIEINDINFKLDSESLSNFALTEFGLTFYDKDAILIQLIEDKNVNLNNFLLEIKLNDNVLFKGNLDNLSIVYSRLENSLECVFKPCSYRINLTDTVINNTINLAPLNISSLPVKLTDFVNKIFKLAYPNINVEVLTDFMFVSSNNSFTPPILTITDVNQIYIDERVFGSYTNTNFIFNDADNYGTIIKRLAFTLGCITGFVSENKAMFMPFISDTKPYREINEGIIIDYKVEGIREKVECFKLNPSEIYAGNYTNITGKYLVKDIYNVFLQQTDFGLLRVISLIYNNQYYSIENAVLSYWKDYFLSKSYSLLYTIELVGIDYNPYEDIMINNKRLMPVEISINLKKYTTKIKALLR